MESVPLLKRRTRQRDKGWQVDLYDVYRESQDASVVSETQGLVGLISGNSSLLSVK
jgi:hypothetical protein